MKVRSQAVMVKFRKRIMISQSQIAKRKNLKENTERRRSQRKLMKRSRTSRRQTTNK